MKRRIPLDNLKKIRLGLDMSQNDFGDILGFPRSGKLNQSSYRKYENGELSLSAEQAYIIIQTFNISLKKLLQY